MSMAMVTEIHEEIMRRLRATEVEHGVRILFAVESGSRAWGFASADSDYDVRFVYARQSEWYLSIDVEHKRDVIEYPIVDDIDLNGWDIRKALRLFRASNPGLVEWIQSSIVYLQDGKLLETLRELLPRAYSLEAGIYHYRSTALSNSRTLNGDLVKRKKYFYVLRPLLAVRWLEAHGTPAPMEFEKLLPLLSDPELLRDIHALLDEKRHSTELGLGPRIPSVDEFIAAEFERLENTTPSRSIREGISPVLDSLFREMI